MPKLNFNDRFSDIFLVKIDYNFGDSKYIIKNDYNTDILSSNIILNNTIQTNPSFNFNMVIDDISSILLNHNLGIRGIKYFFIKVDNAESIFILFRIGTLNETIINNPNKNFLSERMTINNELKNSGLMFIDGSVSSDFYNIVFKNINDFKFLELRQDYNTDDSFYILPVLPDEKKQYIYSRKIIENSSIRQNDFIKVSGGMSFEESSIIFPETIEAGTQDKENMNIEFTSPPVSDWTLQDNTTNDIVVSVLKDQQQKQEQEYQKREYSGAIAEEQKKLKEIAEISKEIISDKESGVLTPAEYQKIFQDKMNTFGLTEDVLSSISKLV